MKERPKDPSGYPMDFAELRFRKVIELDAFPHAGDRLELTTRTGPVINSNVVRVDIDEERQLFVLSCQYGKRAITGEEYAALADDPDWQLKHLLEP
jgi:hypothetical protein